ncbi:MAG: hypothetical protein QNJ12_11315 [Ilumatobacter sp.]|uniref:hypothetical protein n=1 Tax=Ilumatobacter sp. TaxID=1967498 RepID=UPI002618D727|nr:hypothetical protein [Ilumatobacter sp.]MDJ0769379.1 hypothetical protein [Ilumatobacter sp.]
MNTIIVGASDLQKNSAQIAATLNRIEVPAVLRPDRRFRRQLEDTMRREAGGHDLRDPRSIDVYAEAKEQAAVERPADDSIVVEAFTRGVLCAVMTATFRGGVARWAPGETGDASTARVKLELTLADELLAPPVLASPKLSSVAVSGDINAREALRRWLVAALTNGNQALLSEAVALAVVG